MARAGNIEKEKNNERRRKTRAVARSGTQTNIKKLKYFNFREKRKEEIRKEKKRKEEKRREEKRRESRCAVG